MPANFPEVWLDRVETNLTTNDDAPWLAGIPEIASAINEVNPGSGDSEANEIHLPMTDFEVDVLINNTTYPIPVQQYEDGTVTIKLNKFQTKRVPLTDDQTIGAAYDIIDTVTSTMTTNITESKYAKAIHSLGPAGHDKSKGLLVLKATGRSGKLDSEGNEIIWRDENGFLMLTYKDLVSLKTAIDALPKALRWPKKGRRLVLCGLHEGHLLTDRERFGDQLNDLASGTVKPIVAGFELYSNFENPYYDGTNKVAYGAVINEATQFEASIAFHVRNVGVKTGLTKQYFAPAGTDPAYQQNVVSYRHYHVVTPKRNKYIAAIASAKMAG